MIIMERTSASNTHPNPISAQALERLHTLAAHIILNERKAQLFVTRWEIWEMKTVGIER